MQALPFPWRRPRHELLLLSLVAVVALAPVYSVNPQDVSRLCLSQALMHGHVAMDGCYGLDHSAYRGHIYSDKAPGLSLVELPVAAALRLPKADTMKGNAPWRLWLIRLIAVGVAFVACVFLVGRIVEGLAPGYGPLAIVAFGLGTLVSLFASGNFSHVPAAALGLGAFALAWNRRPLAAGVLASAAALVEYQAALVIAILGVYVLVAGVRPAVRYVVGLVPGLALLAAYNWAAFGAPWHFSYDYVANVFTEQQQTGFFGIGAPHVHAIYEVFTGNGGLLVISPVLALAAWGLVLMWRDRPREAAVCGAVTAAFILLDCGYFQPYGGSPGPRFLVPALPFLALGLGPAFARAPRLSMAFTAFSVVATTARMLVWNGQRDENALTMLARVPSKGWSSHFAEDLVRSVFGSLTSSRALGVAVIAVAALAALVVAIRAAWRRHAEQPAESSRSVRGLAVVAGALVAVAVLANAGAIFANPYPTPPDIRTEVFGSVSTVPFTSHVLLDVSIENHNLLSGYGGIVVVIQLPDGMRLDGPVHYERGSGCTGTTTLRCNMTFLSPNASTALRLSVQMVKPGDQTLRTSVSAIGQASKKGGSYTVHVD
jgi:hypothetical protein